jgi:DNA polymerase/3'-5' exonuclease PolX
MKYQEALEIALLVKTLLEPHCHRIEIAGSIRRCKPDVKDIEIVAIPRPYDTGLFASGIAPVVNQWKKVKGELPCKYTQRVLPACWNGITKSIKLDLFFAEPGNWGLIYAMRTGSADYSHKVLACEWVQKGYHSKGGFLHTASGKPIAVPEEQDLFERIGVPYIQPELRDLRS